MQLPAGCSELSGWRPSTARTPRLTSWRSAAR